MHPDGTTSSVAFVVDPPPTATSVSPNTVNIGNTNFVLTITGTNLNSGVSVAVSSGSTSVSVANSNITSTTPTSITVSLPSSVLTQFSPAVAGAASSVPLNIVVSDGGSTSTLTGALTLLFPNVTGLSPTSVASGGAPFTLTVNGSNFLGTSVIHWCGSGTGCTPGTSDTALTTTLVTNAVTHVQSLQAPVSSALIATTGTAVITVENLAATATQSATLSRRPSTSGAWNSTASRPSRRRRGPPPQL